MVECQGSVREGQVCVGMSECILGVDGSDRGDGLRRSRRSRPVLVPFAAPSKLVARSTLLPLISFCSPLLNVCFSPAQRPLHGAKYRRGGEDIHRRELRRERNRRYQESLRRRKQYVVSLSCTPSTVDVVQLGLMRCCSLIRLMQYFQPTG